MFNHHLIKRSLAGGLVIAAAGFPSVAQARYIGGEEGSVPVAPPASVSSAPQRLDQLQRNVQQRFLPAASPRQRLRPPRRRRRPGGSSGATQVSARRERQCCSASARSVPV